jgi:hypothetical protein
MGRYYTGSISGKFWFAIQDSDDASNFGVEYKYLYYYHVCGCEYEESNPNLYCSSCYVSYDEHMKDMIENDIEDHDNQTWHKSENEIYYEFKESDIEFVKNEVEKLESLVGNYIESYEIVEKNDEINYDLKLSVRDSENPHLELCARLCLGKQILYCLEKNKYCTFFAEL